jgi:phosphoribosylamine--glycine ligase
MLAGKPVGEQMNIVLIGGGAREHALGEALVKSGRSRLFTVAHNENPGLLEISDGYLSVEESDTSSIVAWCRARSIDLAVIGLEDPLAVGLPDALAEIGVPTVGPSMRAARLEMSKLFTRELMRRYSIPGQVKFQYFTEPAALREFLLATSEEFALKPIGLTAGKGVKVMGEQLHSRDEAIEYGFHVINDQIGGEAGILVEERLVGDEFTLQAFVDGNAVVPMPLVRDFKRALDGDLGPNTGSMGSYSQPDGLLPFVGPDVQELALEIVKGAVGALREEGVDYRGIIYGQFMIGAQGLKLVEFNARFGDPEALNVLPLLEQDFVDVCDAIVHGTLDQLKVSFTPRATVCKYVTPHGYPGNPREGAPLRVDREAIRRLGVRVYFAKVNQRGSDVLTTSSRSIALVGIADTILQAEQLVEKSLDYIQGDYHVRHDIGRVEASVHTGSR